MFDKIRKAIVQKTAEVRELIGHPPDLHAVPAVLGTSFGALAPDVLSAYLGRDVLAVEPMGSLGPAATSVLGRRVQERLRERAEDAPLRPGEIVAGQLDRIEAEMRAEGATDEMIAMIRDRIGHQAVARTTEGWDVEFTQGHRASVQLFALGTEDAAVYEHLEHQWDRENGTDGHRPQEPSLLSATVHRSTARPYETYCLKGRLAARGTAHVAVAQSARVADDVLAGLATLALRTVEPA